MKNGTPKFNLTPALAVIVIVLAIGAAFYLGNQGKQPASTDITFEKEGTPGPSEKPKAPTPTPTVVPLVQGKETYNITQGAQAKGPKMSLIEIDNHEPKKGQKQTFTLTLMQRSGPVQSASVTIATDTKEQTIPLTLSSGTNTDGKWQGTWTAEDTLLRRYFMKIEAKDARETASFTLTLRNQ